jgi:hypothetical protein
VSERIQRQVATVEIKLTVCTDGVELVNLCYLRPDGQRTASSAVVAPGPSRIEAVEEAIVQALPWLLRDLDQWGKL